MKEAEEAKTLCLLSVPGALGATDLLAFAAACQQDIAHVRVLRDGSPDHYMALFTWVSLITYQMDHYLHTIRHAKFFVKKTNNNLFYRFARDLLWS